jgi:hypothetical protein
VALADRTGVTVVGLIHVNKSKSSDPLTVLMGSRAFVAVARAVLFVMEDPDNDRNRLLGQPKNNLGRTDDLPTLVFGIVGQLVANTPDGEVWTGRLEWRGESAQTLREAIDTATQKPGDKTATQEATEWLEDFLTAKGGGCQKKEIAKEARDAGHERNALDRARKRLKITFSSGGFPRETSWYLPIPSSRLNLGERDTTETTETTRVGGRA